MIEEADQLYGLALEDFVAERDALAKALRAGGRREDAAAVKALRKPSVVVWAVNQAMRSQREAARALIGSADRAAAHPGDRDALRAHGDALEELARAAAGLLSGKGRELSQDSVLKVRGALHAASVDRELRDDFVAGRLATEPAPAGFGAITAMPKARPARKAKAARKPTPKAPSAAARRRVTRAEDRLAAARSALAAAERELADAHAALEAGQG